MSKGNLAGNTSTGLLKALALAAMFCDHAGKMLYASIPEMRIIGRMAFPLYAWCMVVGAHYTRSMPKYILRLALVAVISQPLYMVALNHPWNAPNIFLTLILGLIGIWGLKEKKLLSHIWAPLLVMALAAWIGVDYGWRGVLIMMLLWGVRNSRPGIAAVMIAFCLYWGSTSSTVASMFGYSLHWMNGLPISSMLQPWLRLQALAVLALPLMLIHFPRDVKMPIWLGYSLYPLHLIALIVMEGQMLPSGWASVGQRFMMLVWEPFIHLFG